MKKIKLIVKLLPLLILFLLFTNTSFAQTVGTLFNMSAPVVTQKITAATHKVPQPVDISPFTTIIIPPASFPGEVTLYAYSGIWDKIKSILPEGQSPINSFYFVFKNSNNKTVKPAAPIIIQTVNNYIGTDSFFYPVGLLGIDTAKEQKRIGHVTISVSLPVEDSGFISAANINLKQDDSSLNPVFIKTTPTSTPNQPVPSGINSISALLLIIGIIIIVVIAIVVFLAFNNKRKK